MEERNMAVSLPDYIGGVLRRLRAAGYAAYAVGGCVRDSLMGRSPADFDLATAAPPEEILRIFAGERVVTTGVKHGTVTVLAGGRPIEVTAFRVDGAYSDARRPDRVTFTASLTEDLARRDFTVNALAWDDENGRVIDPFGGTADISRRVIRCVGDPDTRFGEDALRILRALRFSSALGFKIAPETAAALRRNRALLRNISAERVATELCGLLRGQNVRRVLLDYTEVLGVVLPEILPMVGFDQKNPYHIYDVWEHTAVCVENAPDTAVLRLAALLHDIGKPATFTEDERGGHFYDHAKAGAALADAILRRLKFDADTRERVVLLVRRHADWVFPTAQSVKRKLNKMGPEAFFELLDLMRADTSAQSSAQWELRPEIDRLEEIARDILARQDCFSLKDLAVNGRDLIAAGMEPGPALGAALAELLDAVIDGAVGNEKDALLAYLRDGKR